MPPSLALLVWLVLTVALFHFDPAKEPKVSAALWVPLIWMFIIGTRLPSQWLGGTLGSGYQALENGNPLDRTIDLALILLSIAILILRSFKWEDFYARNTCLVIFLSFALVSVLWSDFPFVAFKRWFKDLGNYLVMLVVISDRRPLQAVQTLLRRLCYLLIPLSAVLIKYFPDISRSYDSWTGVAQMVGPATGKNLLGVIALVSGLFFVWDTVIRWPSIKQRRTKHIVLVNAAFMVMTLWVLLRANSRTADVCLILGCIVIAMAQGKIFRRRPGFLQAIIPLGFCCYLVLALGLGMNGELAQLVGKDVTLTDRTKIWDIVLGMNTNPVIGTGYETFWMGTRLKSIWETSGLGEINEAHNGYLEVYLQLGGVGITLLCGYLIASYRNICKALRSNSVLASLSLSVWIVLLFYSWTEVGFRNNLVWLTFLLSAFALQGRAAVERVPLRGSRKSQAILQQSPKQDRSTAPHGAGEPAREITF